MNVKWMVIASLKSTVNSVEIPCAFSVLTVTLAREPAPLPPRQTGCVSLPSLLSSLFTHVPVACVTHLRGADQQRSDVPACLDLES